MHHLPTKVMWFPESRWSCVCWHLLSSSLVCASVVFLRVFLPLWNLILLFSESCIEVLSKDLHLLLLPEGVPMWGHFKFLWSCLDTVSGTIREAYLLVTKPRGHLEMVSTPFSSRAPAQCGICVRHPASVGYRLYAHESSQKLGIPRAPLVPAEEGCPGCLLPRFSLLHFALTSSTFVQM